MRRALAPLALLVATAAPLCQPADAQTVLSDYESNDAAQKARASAVWRLAFRPTRQVLEQTVAGLRRTPGVAPELVAEVDRLVAATQGKPDTEARRGLMQAASLLLGKPWTAGQAMVAATSLSPAQPVATGNAAVMIFAPGFATPAVPGGRYELDLLRATPTASATPQPGETVRRLASDKLTGKIQSIKVDLKGLPDGFYIAQARVTAPDGGSDQLASGFHIVNNLAARQQAISARLDRTSGHDSARATALYPFELAAALNAGRREVISYDFPAALRRSEAIAEALEKEADPVVQATGLQNRAYRFAPTGELLPFQLYVPKAWRADRKWPLVVALHGANLDETNMLGRAGARLQALAEQRGIIVVAPLGYRLNSGYGVRGMRAFAPEETRRRHSEADVLAVADLVAAEYNVDPARTYLTGNSMGGAGTWWIGARHPQRWAAIAPAAFGGVEQDYVSGLAQLPILAVVGDRDELGMRDRVAESVALLRSNGLRPGYLEIPGGTHASGFDIALPQILDFFGQHRK
ncbi:PHB depolymerase family esterase [Sandarakinorhabdus sp.]|uniref:carboxylesterase family protein n=1 Tax=Sandarakinorhabdus sp. TaxID=1916663 RepID=UPI003342CE2E